MSQMCTTDTLAADLANILTEYAGSSTENVKKCVNSVGKRCVDEIKRNAPVHSGRYGKTSKRKNGTYKKSWRMKKTKETADSVFVTCYASGGEYSLTHLLENGHASRNGGFVPAKKHIGPVEEKMAKILEKEVKIVLQ